MTNPEALQGAGWILHKQSFIELEHTHTSKMKCPRGPFRLQRFLPVSLMYFLATYYPISLTDMPLELPEYPRNYLGKTDIPLESKLWYRESAYFVLCCVNHTWLIDKRCVQHIEQHIEQHIDQTPFIDWLPIAFANESTNIITIDYPILELMNHH